MTEPAAVTEPPAPAPDLEPAIDPVLAGIDLMQPLTDAERRLVAGCFTSVTYEFGETVVAQGDVADAFYVIGSGRARVLVTGDDGQEVPLDVLGPGDGFGEIGLFEQQPRSATVRASTPLHLWRLDRSVFVALLTVHPSLHILVKTKVRWMQQDTFLRLHPVFRDLSERWLGQLVDDADDVELAPGERVAAGRLTGTYIVRSGRLAAFAGGTERYGLHAGDLFDATSVTASGEQVEVRAVSDARLLHLDGDVLASVLAAEPDFAGRVQQRCSLIARRLHSPGAPVPPSPADRHAGEHSLLAAVAEDADTVDLTAPAPVRRRRRRRFAVVRQLDAMDCGPACVAMLCRHFGYNVSLAAIRAAVGTGLDGTSLGGILRGAPEIGLEFRAVKSSPDRLGALPLPVILHWGGNHWVVMYGRAKGKVQLADPAVGLRTVTDDELAEKWSGYAAIPTPTPRLADAPRGGVQLGWLRPFVRPYRRAITVAAVLALLAIGLQMSLPVLTQVVIDGLLHHRDGRWVSAIVGIIGVALFASIACTVGERRTLARVAVAVDGRALDYVAERLLRLPVGYFQVRRTADIQRRLEGMREVRRVLVEDGIYAVTAAVQLVAAFVVMAAYSWVVALLFLAVVPLYGLLMRYSAHRLRPAFEALEEAFGRYQGKQLDAIRGIEVVKTSGAEEGFRRGLVREFDGLQERLYRRDLTTLVYDGLVSLATLGIVASFLWVGALLVIHHALTIGGLVAVNALVLTATGPLRILLSFWDHMQYVGVLLGRLQDVHENRPEQQPGGPHTAIDTLTGHVRLHELSFAYPQTPDRPILDRISLDVPAGLTVAIVGRSGSGKSTLLRCLTGLLMPTSGSVEYDDVDLRDLELTELRRRIGFVLQEPFLFDATIADNVAFGHDEPDLARVHAATSIANAAEFVDRLPLGHHTRVGDSGLRLSTGQAQRLAIARAVYDQPQVLLMDEPTSALDAESERAVKEGIDRLLRGRTAFVVAHRLSTIRDADLICVLEQGRIVEQGTHDELLAHGGLYAYLYAQQLSS